MSGGGGGGGGVMVRLQNIADNLLIAFGLTSSTVDISILDVSVSNVSIL